MVEGDALSPSLRDGDEVLIQRYLANENLRDGPFVIRDDADLHVRRIAVEPSRNRIAVLTHNPAYPNWDGLPRNGARSWAGFAQRYGQ